jgi:predicted Zn-dependent protease
VPERKRNHSHLLPGSVERINLDIFDHSLKPEENQPFLNLVETINEILVSFPGLVLSKIHFSQSLSKVYLANTLGLKAKYKKTNFNLKLTFSMKGNIIEINRNATHFKSIDPHRLISRAHNLLSSLTDNDPVEKNIGHFIFSPEASVFVLNEFSDYFKLNNRRGLPKIGFSAALNIVDDPFMNGQSGSVPFDDEGVQSGETKLLDKGVFRQPISNLETAFKFDSSSSGNGFRSENSLFPRVRFSNLYIKPSVIPLDKLMREAGGGILVSLLKLKHVEKNKYLFSAYGFQFREGIISEPVHFYFRTSFVSYFANVLKVSREIKFFYNTFNIGSPYILTGGKWKSQRLFEI